MGAVLPKNKRSGKGRNASGLFAFKDFVARLLEHPEILYSKPSQTIVLMMLQHSAKACR
jgi:hypothetical protein